jgi:hypothetical protein
MTEDQITQAARLWNQRMDTFGIAAVVMLNEKLEPLIYRMLWRAIIPKAISLRGIATGLPRL